MSGLRPGEAEAIEERLRIKWDSHSQIERVFANPTSVVLLTVYVQACIKTGKAVDFHKSFFFGLMKRDLFARSFIEDLG
jgi:hypothetical protein